MNAPHQNLGGSGGLLTLSAKRGRPHDKFDRGVFIDITGLTYDIGDAGQYKVVAISITCSII